jgi:3-hydroxyacyl-CoA dehydrogenase
MLDLAGALKNVAVLGAAGKMGAGISAVLLLEIAKECAKKTGTFAPENYSLHLIDSQNDAFNPLLQYLEKYIWKYAEKNFKELRSWLAPPLIEESDRQVINRFVQGAMSLIHCDTRLEAAKDSHLIFEAIVEDMQIKAEVLRFLARLSSDAYFLSNTSSIPIHVLNEKADLQGRILGFHFYNPPVVQELIELVVNETTDPTLCSIAKQLALRMKKTIVFSKDIAGFIGNGYLIREIGFALWKLQKLSVHRPLPHAVYLTNRATQEFLLRPMGIFQLIDYVGIDVIIKISRIMRSFIPSLVFSEKILQKLAAASCVGGYDSSAGIQKDGFFRYSVEGIQEVYSFSDRLYLPLEGSSWKKDCDLELGPFPLVRGSWKELRRDPDRQKKLDKFFSYLEENKELGFSLAREFLWNLQTISEGLVSDGVAENLHDVDTVLKKGFYHLYGTLDLHLERPKT